ncbi:hypothetical protein VC81_04405 [Levilactobacillus spicheri]|uniref:Uncharacterized protein n=1 Tax=Levilactobacillus spicheri TaxID=216463 RepID=A0A0F3RUG4_9LACO|nr:hypothetical protein VC81_04405 [Levilactobacillus spicheri]
MQGFGVVPTTVILLAGVKRRDLFSLVILVRFRGPGDSRTFLLVKMIKTRGCGRFHFMRAQLLHDIFCKSA